MSTAVRLCLLFFVFLNCCGLNSVKTQDANRYSKETTCSEWFKPCTCFSELLTDHIYVDCQYVSPTAVFEAFNKPNTPIADIYSMTYLMKYSNDTLIPSDLLGKSKIIDAFKLKWEGTNEETTLTIDANAFRSSSETLSTFTMSGFNVKTLDWSFLNNLNALKVLALSSIRNIQTFAELPALTSPLTYLMVQNSTGFINIPNVPSTLVKADFTKTYMSDETAFNVFPKLSKANETLREVSFSHVPLTILPPALNDYLHLEILNFEYTEISTLTEGAFSGLTVLKGLYLRSSQISQIDAGAFKGNFSGTFVMLSSNPLERLEGAVFKSMLDDMYCSNAGVLELENCNITCDCGLAWLIRDNPHLLSRILYGTCSNSTSFRDLDPAGFSICEARPREPICGVMPTDEPQTDKAVSLSITGTGTIVVALAIGLCFFYQSVTFQPHM